MGVNRKAGNPRQVRPVLEYAAGLRRPRLLAWSGSPPVADENKGVRVDRLSFSVRHQDALQVAGKGHVAAAPGSFGFGKVPALRVARQSTPHAEVPICQVNVAPFEGKRLTGTEAGIKEQTEHRKPGVFLRPL